MEAWAAVIGNLGFPIVVSIYLLTRLEGKLEHLTESIRGLSDALKNPPAGV
jgi:hypothetical protein